MVKLTHLSAIRFSGADAGEFLHNQLSADVKGLGEGDSVFACYCEPKGRVLALILVYKEKEDLVAIMSSSLVTTVSDRLKIYRMRSKVSIDVLEENSLSGLQSDIPPKPAIAGSHAIRVPGSGLWILYGSQNLDVEKEEQSPEKWKIQELHLGISWLAPGTSGQFLPQMLGFEELGAVNYRKGCYPGQEIVARAHYLGKVKRHPRLISCLLKVAPTLMDKISIHDDDRAYDAVVVDSETTEEGNIFLLVVTRMSPELTAKKIEIEDEFVTIL